MPPKRAPRKPRGKRAPRAQTARKATQQANESGASRRAVRGRLVALEARMTVLERLLGSINTPKAQAWADQVLTEVLEYSSLEEEE